MITSFQSQSLSEKLNQGNVTSTFSDHLTQFILLKDLFSKIPAVKSLIGHDWRKFESYKFISDLNQTDCEQILSTDKSDVNFSINQYLSKIDSILEIHAPLLKVLTKKT